MATTIQKWGNSLAVRIPKAFADEVGLEYGTVIELQIVDGQLVIKLIEKPIYELNALLAQVTDDNLHLEVDTGDAMGNEVW